MLRKSHLPDGAGDDENADVVGEGIYGDDKKPVAIRTVVQRATGDDLVVEERDFDPTAVLDVSGIHTFHVSRIAGEVTDEEHAFQARQRTDDAVVWLRIRRRRERKLGAGRIEVLGVSLQRLLFHVA